MNPATDKLSHVLFWLFGIFVFSSAFSITLSQTALEAAVVVFVVIVLRSKDGLFIRPLRGFYLAVAVYLGWLIISALAGPDFLRSIFMAREEWLFLAIPVGVFLMREKRYTELLLSFLAAGVLVVLLWSLFALAARVWWAWPIGRIMISDGLFRVMGNFSHALTYGNYCATAALFLLGYGLVGGETHYRWSRWLIPLGGLAAVIGTMLANSRGPAAALFVGLILLLFFLRGKRRWLVAGLLVGMVVLIGSVGEMTERFTIHHDRTGLERHLGTYWQGSRLFIWKNTVRIIGEHPVFGVGPGNFQEAYREIGGEGLNPLHCYGHAHNDFLNVGAQMGIPGGVAFGLLWLCALLYFWRAFKRAGPGSIQRRLAVAALLGSLVFLGTSLTEATFADEEVRALLMFVWAAGLGSSYKSGPGRSVERV